MDPMDIDLTIDVLDTPDRLKTRGSHGITDAEDENHPQQNRFSKEGSRDQPLLIDSGSRRRARHPSKCFGSSNLSTASSSSSRNPLKFGKAITVKNPTHSAHNSIHNNYQDSFVDFDEINDGEPGLANATSSLLGRTSFRTAREEIDNMRGLDSSNDFRVGNSIQEKFGNGGFMSHDHVALPRINKQKKLVRDGYISPTNVCKAKQLAEKDSNSSVVSEHKSGSNASSAPPTSIGVKELVAEDRDSSYTRKGKGVITHPCSSKELNPKNMNSQSRSSINFNEKGIGPCDYNKGDGNISEELGGWRSTRNRYREINRSALDEHHENSSGKGEKGASASNGNDKCPKLISSEHVCPQSLKESVPPYRTRLGRFNGTRSTASMLMKRQKQGSTSSTCGQCSTSVSDDQEVMSLNSPEEPTSSRSTSRNVVNSNQIIEVDEVSPQLRRDARDNDDRVRQLEADERLARELQEQFYNEAPVFGVGELDEHIALALQQHDDSDNEFDRERDPVVNDRVLIPSLRRQSQTRASSSVPRRVSLPRSTSLGRSTRQRIRFPGQAHTLLPSRGQSSLFPEDMDVDMRMNLLGALEEFNDMGLSASILQVPRDFNENDYEMLLALDDNNDQHSGASARLINGLSQSTVQSESFDETCAVCLETPTIGEVIRHLPCLHKFHKDCIDPWLRRRTSCPVCKSSVT